MLSGTESSILLLQFCFSNKPWASHYQFPPKAAKHKKKKKKKNVYAVLKQFEKCHI